MKQLYNYTKNLTFNLKMLKFRVIPVIDILNANAVHAYKGERSKYSLLKSFLFNTSDPYEIIKILHENYNFNEFYIADLDSILKKNPNIKLISKIIKNFDVKIMLDPGIINKEDLSLYNAMNLNKIILGLETIKDLEIIKNAINLIGGQKVILSFDLYKGTVLTNIKKLLGKTPIEIIDLIEKIGVQEVILLDLYRVGQKIGNIPHLYLKIRKKYKSSLLVGGGIKNLHDINQYFQNSFSGILIATALYDGTIKVEDLTKFQ